MNDAKACCFGYGLPDEVQCKVFVAMCFSDNALFTFKKSN